MAKTIPAGWQEKTLGDILDKGASVLSANKLNNCQGEYPVYGARGLIAKVNFYQQDKEYLAIIKDGAGVGRVYHYEANSSVLGTLQYLFPKCEINIRFGYYYLQSIDFSKYYQGAAIPHIYYNDYKKEKIILPSLPEQERIVAKLDKAFEAIDKAKAIAENNLKNAKELFESSLNKAFTENTNDWEEKKLGEVCIIIAGQSPNSQFYNTEAKGLPFYQGKKEFTNKYIGAPSVWTTEITKEALSGDILMSVRAPVGPINYATEKCCIGRGLASIRNSKLLSKDFLFYYLLSIQQKIGGHDGAVFNSISRSEISAVKIRFPSIPDQQNIVARLDKLHEQTKQLEAVYSQKIKNLDELKQSILKRAFRGEL